MRLPLPLGTLARSGLGDEQQSDVAQHHQNREEDEGHLPVIRDTCRFQIVGHEQRRHAAELVSGPPADNGDRRTGGHAPGIILVDLLDPQRVDGDVLRRRTDGDDKARTDHQRQRADRIDGAPEQEADKDDRLQGQDPRLAVAEPVGQHGNPQPVDQRRPQKVEGVDAEDQAGPADRAP